MSINRVELSGNLTRDPELRASAVGTNILSFGMAVNDRRKNQQTGEWEDYANFVDCVLFGSRAEYLSKALFKGAKVFVCGKLRYSAWERDGQKRSKIEVLVDDLDFGFPPSQNQQQRKSNPFQQLAEQHQQQPAYQQQQPTYQQPVQEPEQPELPNPDSYDDSIPF